MGAIIIPFQPVCRSLLTVRTEHAGKQTRDYTANTWSLSGNRYACSQADKSRRVVPGGLPFYLSSLPLFRFDVLSGAQSASSSPSSSRARKNTFIRPICAAAELSSRMCDGGGACMRAAPLLPSFPSSQPARSSHRQAPVSWAPF